MPTPMILELMKQLFRKPATNIFPLKYAPKSVTKLLEKVSSGEAKISPPVPVPPKFRGKIRYDKEKCIGCKLCLNICPSKSIEFIEENKKIRIYVSRCTFCSQCNEVCPVNALSMSEDFLLADYDKFSKDLIVE